MTYYNTRSPQRARLGPLVVVLLIGAGLFGYWVANRFNRGTSSATPRAVEPRGDLAAEEKSTIQIFKEARQSVVFITTMAERFDLGTLNVTEMPKGTGSGFIWDNAGHIVTNFHVIRGASAAQVTLWDHTAYPATLTGASEENDLAVLKIDAPPDKLRPIPIGTSHDLQVGQNVFAIGDPFGLDQTLTTGVVSAVGRSISTVSGQPLKDVIQTDAAINPGNSGGPLLDSAGRLIGVNTAIYSPSGSSAGIGFAIPVDTVNRVVPELIAHGKIVRPRLGLSFSDAISHQITPQLGVSGLLVVGVQPGSPAAAAGLRGTQRLPDGSIMPGDVIQKVGNQPVVTSADYFAALSQYHAGDTVPLTIFRDGQSLQVNVSIGSLQ